MIDLESWYKFYCRKCGKENWFCNGNTDDLSGVDVEGVECWKCHHKEQLDEIDDLPDDYCHFELCQKKPS